MSVQSAQLADAIRDIAGWRRPTAKTPPKFRPKWLPQAELDKIYASINSEGDYWAHHELAAARLSHRHLNYGYRVLGGYGISTPASTYWPHAAGVGSYGKSIVAAWTARWFRLINLWPAEAMVCISSSTMAAA